MRFTGISVAIWPDVGWRIQWGIDDVTPDEEILLYRSSGDSGPWTHIATLPYNAVTYQDDLHDWRGFVMTVYYRIVVRKVAPPHDIVLESKPRDLQSTPSKITEEMIRQYELLLKGVNTHPGFGAWDFALYKRTRYGSPCPNCIDQYTGEVGVHGRCQQCMGTGYLEGWSIPTVFRARWMTPNPKSHLISTTGITDEVTRQLWTAAFPHIEPGDILVEKGTNLCWHVKNVTASEPGRVITSQSCTVSAVDKQKVEGNLEFPV